MTQKQSYFIEGLQGAGKSTLVNRLAVKHPEKKVCREGDYTPVDLTWCAYVDETTYQDILARFPSLSEEMARYAVQEKNHHVIPYTRILTDIPGFHKYMEQFEIYNGNLDRETFENTVLSRLLAWEPEGEIFECAMFQNILENMMLYLQMQDEEILDFYSKVHGILQNKPYKIFYLDVEDIAGSLEVIKKERADENGVELWFPLMVNYLEASPYGQTHGLWGKKGLLKHLERREQLERKLIKEVFRKETIVMKAKAYDRETIP